MVNENIIDVLIYLYENYLDSEHEIAPDHIMLQQELAQAGFPGIEIQKAFQWLDELAVHQISDDYKSNETFSFRVFSDEEVRRMDVESRGFVMFLEENGIIDHNSRELVLDRILALDQDEIAIDDIKWVVLLVLMNHPGGESQHALMEDLMFNSMSPYVH